MKGGPRLADLQAKFLNSTQVKWVPNPPSQLFTAEVAHYVEKVASYLEDYATKGESTFDLVLLERTRSGVDQSKWSVWTPSFSSLRSLPSFKEWFTYWDDKVDGAKADETLEKNAALQRVVPLCLSLCELYASCWRNLSDVPVSVVHCIESTTDFSSEYVEKVILRFDWTPAGSLRSKRP